MERAVSWALATSPVAMTDAEYHALRQLIQETAGIHLGNTKMPLLMGRLNRRLRELGIATFTEYLQRVLGDADELVRMLDLVSTNETRFFREPQHFEFLVHTVFPSFREAHARGERRNHVRVWSAACSTGEEPFSLAMVLLEHFPPESGWSIEIHASDLSTRVLARARSATWPLEREQEIPEYFRRQYMLLGRRSNAGKIRAAPELRRLVQFHRINLYDTHYALDGQFDLIFCRNVLIYFERATKLAVVQRLSERLVPGGYFFLGHAESLHGLPVALKSAIPTVYVRSPTTERKPP